MLGLLSSSKGFLEGIVFCGLKAKSSADLARVSLDKSDCSIFVLLLFFPRQCSSMVSVARASHLASPRSCSRVTKAKNFTVPSVGWPKGLSKPFDTRTGISCEANPRYYAASSMFKRTDCDYIL